MKKCILLSLFVISISSPGFAQTLNRCDYKDNKKDKRSEEEFKRLHAEEVRIELSGDVAAWDSL